MISLNFIKYIRPTNIARNLSDKPKSPYKLLEKTDKMDIAEFSHSNMTAPEEAKTFRRVEIGKKDDKEYRREILSFYDSEGRIVALYHSGRKCPQRMKTFEYGYNKKNRDVAEYDAHTRTVKTTQYFDEGKTWKPIQEEEQYLYYMYDIRTPDNRAARKLHISKNVYDYKTKEPVIHATLTEYPLNIARKDRDPKKTYGMDIVLRDNRPEVIGYSKDNNVEIPKDDKFLPYRMLLGENKQLSLTQYYIDQKGLAPVGISVRFAPDEVAKNICGEFNSNTGEILFREVSKVEHPVLTASHEVEHAYQYSLIGRARHNQTDYETRCREILGTELSFMEMKDSAQYYKGKIKYPRLNPDEDLSKNKDYMNNELEVGAFKAEKKALKEYNEGREKILDVFKCIPGNATI